MDGNELVWRWTWLGTLCVVWRLADDGKGHKRVTITIVPLHIRLNCSELWNRPRIRLKKVLNHARPLKLEIGREERSLPISTSHIDRPFSILFLLCEQYRWEMSTSRKNPSGTFSYNVLWFAAGLDNRTCFLLWGGGAGIILEVAILSRITK